MKNIIRSIAAFVLLSLSAFAGVNSPAASKHHLVNVSGASKVAVAGYDTVAFFTDAKAVNGSPFISSEYNGATYFFATEAHKSLFVSNPEHYVPQFGGFCAYGVAVDKVFPVDINTWQVRNDKLYLNLNPAILEKFNGDFDANVATANKNWPGLVKQSGK